jgi:hypothetical protein
MNAGSSVISTAGKNPESAHSIERLKISPSGRNDSMCYLYRDFFFIIPQLANSHSYQDRQVMEESPIHSKQFSIVLETGLASNVTPAWREMQDAAVHACSWRQ